ncbi:unnamed protein product [Phaeothamnion confervicola]
MESSSTLESLQRAVCENPLSAQSIEASRAAVKKLSKEEKAALRKSLPQPVPAPRPAKRRRQEEPKAVIQKIQKCTIMDIPFAEEFWEMLGAFGDSRGHFGCTCGFGGRVRCPCLRPVEVLEAAVRPFIREVIQDAKMEANSDTFGTKHLQAIMPQEMCEYMRWRKDRDQTRDKSSAEDIVKAGIKGGSGGDGGDGNPVAGTAVGAAAAAAGAVRAGAATLKEKAAAAAGAAAVPTADDEAPRIIDAAAAAAAEEEAGNEHDIHEDEIEEIISGMSSSRRALLRRQFADERSRGLSVEAYAEFRKRREAFFLGRRRGRVGDTADTFRLWAGRRAKGGEDGCKLTAATLQALAFLAHDRVGMIVEDAIRYRCDGVLRELPRRQPLSAAELEAAAERVRLTADAGAGGGGRDPFAAVGAVIGPPEARRGLQFRGDPLAWPRNVLEDGAALDDVAKAADDLVAQLGF